MKKILARSIIIITFISLISLLFFVLGLKAIWMLAFHLGVFTFIWALENA